MVRRDPDLSAVLHDDPALAFLVERHMSPQILWISNIAYDMAFDDLMADEPATKDET